jgi:CRP-like cAMP-binding protein
MTNMQPDLLTDLVSDQADRVLALGTRMTLYRGEELFRLGERADRLVVIQRGRMKLTLPMQVRGREEHVLVEERGPGETIGWSALIPPYRFTLTATAPLETEVIAIAREALQRHFEEFPAVGQSVSLNLASVIGQRLQVFQTMWLREMQRTVELSCA